MAAVVARFGKYINSIKTRSLDRFRIPEKWKGGRLEKYVTYWKVVMVDYKEVAKETYVDAKTRPKKALAILSTLGFFTYAYKTNPSERNYYGKLLENCGEILLLSDAIRNPQSDQHMNFLIKSYNSGLVRHLNLGFFSLMWLDNYDEACALYQAQCSYLQPRYLTFYERIVDVGFLGYWYVLGKKMEDFDVNPEEWKDKPEALLY